MNPRTLEVEQLTLTKSQIEPDKKLSWLCLLLICLFLFGRYYVHDMPQAIEKELLDYLGLSNLQYNLLFSVYSVPNMILPLVGGYIIDKLGIRFSVCLFSLLVFIGQSFFFLGIYQKSYYCMILGRTILGFGGETLPIAKAVAIIKWFPVHGQAFAFGLAMAATKLAGMSNSFLTPRLYSLTKSLNFVAIIGITACILSVIAAAFFSFLDRKAERENPRMKNLEADRLRGQSYAIGLKEIAAFQPAYWYLAASAALSMGSFFAFLNQANAYLQLRNGMTAVEAGGLLTILVYFVSLVLCPVAGIIADKYGHRDRAIIVMNSTIVLSLIFLLVLPDSTHSPLYYIPFVAFGAYYAFGPANNWCSVPLLAKYEESGRAFGVTFSILNITLSSMPIFVGLLQDSAGSPHQGFFRAVVLLAMTGALGVVLAVKMKIADKDALLSKVYNNENNQSKEPEEMTTEDAPQ